MRFSRTYHTVAADKKQWFLQLYDKGFWYWFRIALLTTLGVLAGQLIGQADVWREVRYKIYHFQTSKLHRRHPVDLRVAFVLVGDDEYWTGTLARRVPIKRDYLARLIRAVDKAAPAVIAMDFDLHSPTPDGSLLENPDYWCERSELLRAIKDVATRHPVVIPKSLVSSRSGRKQINKEVSDTFGSDLTSVKNVFPGYIRFAPDLRMIPARLTVEGRSEAVDSFAFAILQAYSPEMYENFVKEEKKQGTKGDEFLLRFGSFLDESAFTNLSYSAKDVLMGNPDVLQHLNHKIVLLGGKWHRDGFGAGEWSDEHLTPAGRIVGVYTHANYAEALRLGQYYPEISEAWIISFEVALVVGASIFLALDISKWYKIAATLGPSLVMMALSYVFLQNLGLFFEFIIPMFVLVTHNVVEHLEWRRAMQA